MKTSFDNKDEEEEEVHCLPERHFSLTPDFDGREHGGSNLTIRLDNAGEDTLASFGMFMEEERLKAGKTLKDVSERSGLSLSSLSRYENGAVASLTKEKLTAWAKALSYTIQESELIWSIYTSTVETYNQVMGFPTSEAIADLHRVCKKHGIPINRKDRLFTILESSFDELIQRTR